MSAAVVVPIERALGRSLIVGMVAQLLFSQHCRETGARLTRLKDLSAKDAEPFRVAAAHAVQEALR